MDEQDFYSNSCDIIFQKKIKNLKISKKFKTSKSEGTLNLVIVQHSYIV